LKVFYAYISFPKASNNPKIIFGQRRSLPRLEPSDYVKHVFSRGTQEAEIRRMEVRSQPGQIVHRTLSQKYPSQKGLVEWLKV
jgi:hypothetical protein